MSRDTPHPAILAREARINELLDWARQNRLLEGFASLDRWDQSESLTRAKDSLRLHAMDKFSVSGRLASEYADVVIERLVPRGDQLA